MATLCLSCQLCCRDGLFTSVPIRLEEVSGIQAHRLPVVKQGDCWVMRFPCAAHDGCCSIYADRPRTCRDYECDVLVAVAAGSMGESDARAILDRANGLAGAIRSVVHGDSDLWTDVAGYCEDSAEWRLSHPELLLDVAELRRLLHRIDSKNG